MNYYKKVILSFYENRSDREFAEALYDHISEGLKLAVGIKNSRLIKNFLYDLSYKYDLIHDGVIHYFNKAIDYSIVFHDIGKIYYQSNFKRRREYDEYVTYISYVGHELFSALIVKKAFMRYLRKIDIEKEKIGYFRDIIQFPVVFSILFHHHAMNINIRSSYFESNESLMWEISPYLNDLNRILTYVDKDIGDEIIYVIKKITEKDLFKINLELNGLINEIWREYSKGGLKVKLSLLLLSILITIDYISASKRGGSTTSFRNVVKKYYDILVR